MVGKTDPASYWVKRHIFRGGLAVSFSPFSPLSLDFWRFRTWKLPFLGGWGAGGGIVDWNQPFPLEEGYLLGEILRIYFFMIHLVCWHYGTGGGKVTIGHWEILFFFND